MNDTTTTTDIRPLARLAFESNADAYAAMEAAIVALTAENHAGIYGGPAFDAFMARSLVVSNSVLPLFVRQLADRGDVVFTVDGPMTVGDVTDWTDVVLTADGGRVDNAWHVGPESGTPVRYERWSVLVGRKAHGYVDPRSRRIVQTG